MKHGHCHKGNVGKYSLHGASGYAWEHPKIRTQQTYMVLLNDSENPVGANFAPLGSSELLYMDHLKDHFLFGRLDGGVLQALSKRHPCMERLL